MKKIITLALLSTILFVSCKKETPEPQKKKYTVTYHADLPPSGQIKTLSYAVSGHTYTDDATYLDEFNLTLERESGDIMSLNADCYITTPYESVLVEIIVDGATVSHHLIGGTGNQTAYCYYKLP